MRMWQRRLRGARGQACRQFDAMAVGRLAAQNASIALHNAPGNMASIRRRLTIRRPSAEVWDALRDIGALHTRLVAGFVTDCRLEGDARIVTFSNGITARERIIDVDDQQQRVAWSATGGRLSHHNASAQVFPATADTCEVVWIADLLPDEMEPGIAAMIDMGLAAMKRTLESAPR